VLITDELHTPQRLGQSVGVGCVSVGQSVIPVRSFHPICCGLVLDGDDVGSLVNA